MELCKKGKHEKVGDNVRQVAVRKNGKVYMTNICVACRRNSSRHYERITPSRNKSRHRKVNS